MTSQTLLICLAAALPAAVAIIDHWYKWRKEKMHQHAYIMVTVLLVSVLVSWTTAFLADRKHRTEMADSRRSQYQHTSAGT